MKTGESNRRKFLSNTMTAGCALIIPTIIIGCGKRPATPSDKLQQDNTKPTQPASSRSEIEEKGAVSPAATQDSSATAQATTKLSKEGAQYQATPKGSEKCANCQLFNAANNSCQVVAGDIDANAWCVLWVKKSA